jgi:uncharacterized protein
MESIYGKAIKGYALDDVLVIDSHCHIGVCNTVNIPDGSAESMLKSMDMLGVNIACITANASCCSDYAYGNDVVLDALERYPDRFAGYITFNPNYEELYDDEFRRCFRVPGMKAIKIHPSLHGYSLDHKRYDRVFEIAQKNKLPVLIHVWGRPDVAAVDKVAGRYPEVIFLMGHTGAEVRAMENAVDVINRHENCFGDLALSMARQGNVEWLVKETGSHRILYGTDMPFFDPIPAFGRVVFAEISDEDKRNVLGLNMKKLLKWN